MPKQRQQQQPALNTTSATTAKRTRIKQLPDPLKAAYVGQSVVLGQRMRRRGIIQQIMNGGAVLLIAPLGRSKLIRCRRNEHCAGYAAQKKVNGVWQFTRPLATRYRATWHLCEQDEGQ